MLKHISTAGLTTALAITTLLPSSAATATAVSDTQLRNAPVPGGMCRHKAGRLVNGKRDMGMRGGEWIDASATGPMGAGTRAVLSIGCTAGGVSWPETLVFYRVQSGNLQIAAKKYLGDFRASEHADVRSMSVTGRTLHVTWLTYEGCCFERQRFSADMHVRNGKVVVTALRSGRVTHPY